MGRLFKTHDNKITQPYRKGVHNGIDIVAKGQNNISLCDYVISHTEGTVIKMERLYNKTDLTGHSYGNYILIKHPNNYFTLYAHLAYKSIPSNIKIGSKIQKGQIIGYMGNTGHSFGAHLHFEVRNESNIKIDPTPYINSPLPSKESKYSKQNFIRDLKKALKLKEDCSLDNLYKATPKLFNNNKYNEATVVVQKYLISLGISCGSKGANGYFGNDTEKAVKEYQTRYKTGVVDGVMSAKGYMWKSLIYH